MNQPHCKYVDTAFGDPSHRNKVMMVTGVLSAMPSNKADCYATWHRFPGKYYDHWKAAGTTKGYVGPSYADFLPFDFDGKSLDELPQTLDTVREFVQMLQVSYDVEQFRCWFSGFKGFHIALPAALFGGWVPSPDLAGRLKNLAKKLADGFDIDPAIYDQNRLFRLENTINSKSGLYKIPLEVSDLLFKDADTIKDLAKEPRKVEWAAWDDHVKIDACKALYEATKATNKKEERQQTHGPLFPTDLTEGEGRDQQAFLIARKLRDAGCNSRVALEVLRFWDGQQKEPLVETDGEDILEKKIANAYGDRADQGVRVTPDVIKTIEEMAHEYSTYIESLKSRRIELGLKDVDKRLRSIAPGEVLTVLAKSGVGKSAFTQSVLAHIARTQREILSLFCSMEQPLAQCFERWAQMIENVSGYEIEKGWDVDTYRRKVAGALGDRMGDRVLTCAVPGLSLDELEQIVDMAEDKSGKKVNVLAVDYLSLIDTSALDKTLYAQASRAAREIKNIAKRKDLVVILLCQVKRMSGEDGNQPLSIDSARESGAIEESADYLLGLYRPHLEDSEQDDEMVVQILKNRKGMTYKKGFSYYFDRKSLRITELNDFGVPKYDRPEYPEDLEASWATPTNS